jgi:hypothetical protein
MLDSPADVKWITKGSPSRGRRWARSERFSTGALAVRFVVERLKSSGASDIVIDVAGAPMISDWKEIAALYESLPE